VKQASETKPTAADVAAIKALILDMDGVLWRADEPIGDLRVLFDEINRRGYGLVLATNNATLTISQYLKKLQKFGVTVDGRQIVNSPQATAHYLHQRFPAGGSVYIVGEDGLVEALAQQGFYFDGEQAVAVVVGMDRGLTYDKLSRAALLIRAGAVFIGTNPDRTFPVPQGLVPGTGAIIAALEVATEVKPTMIGKPAPEMYRVALERLGTKPEQTLVVGDRLETDIVGAQALGCPTALVLSGVTTEKAAKEWSPPPNWIEQDLTTLLGKLRWEKR
jgi:4-nitrophenyl phosphatase